MQVDIRVPVGLPIPEVADFIARCEDAGFDAKGKALNISILPTLLISALGVMKDVNKAVSIDFKIPGDLVYILGETYEEGGGVAPRVDAQKNNKVYRALAKVIAKDLVASAISVGRGGFGVALAKSAMAGNLGVAVDLTKLPGAVLADGAALFSESQGRIIVSIAPENRESFEQAMLGNSFALIGKVAKNNLEIIGRSRKPVVNLATAAALSAYRAPLKDY